jgi:hypothetical protein
MERNLGSGPMDLGALGVRRDLSDVFRVHVYPPLQSSDISRIPQLARVMTDLPSNVVGIAMVSADWPKRIENHPKEIRLGRFCDCNSVQSAASFVS